MFKIPFHAKLCMVAEQNHIPCSERLSVKWWGVESNQDYGGADGHLCSVLQSWHAQEKGQSLILSCQAGWSSEKPSLVEDVPAQERGLELGDL